MKEELIFKLFVALNDRENLLLWLIISEFFEPQIFGNSIHHVCEFNLNGLHDLVIPLMIRHEAPESATENDFRISHHEKAKRSIASCSQRHRKRDAVEKRFAKTDTFINNYRRSRVVDRYHSNAALKRELIVDGLNSTCILTPESQEGPYCKSLVLSTIDWDLIH